MARSSNTQLIYQAIRIEGGLIPANELVRLTNLQTPDKTEQTDSHYRIPKGLKLRDEVARYWKIGQSLWTEFQTLRQRKDVDAYQVTARNFLVPLLRDVLGFTDLTAGATVDASGHTYTIGYAAREGRLPLVLAGHTQLLDAPTERFGELNADTGKTRRRSPFMLAQEALNASDQSLWAITSNGLSLRILRDNPSLTRPSYVEVDLEALFSEDLYADFTAFWLLAHASRFGAPDAEPADCPWERWRAAGQEAGVAIRNNLRYQVEQALRALGTGFLSHPANTHLREQLQNQEQQAESLGKQVFFEELLGLVYRLIFLSTVEDRTDPTTGKSLIFIPGTTSEVQQRYLSGYSLTWLRERAVCRSSFDTHNDLWQALSITFDALAQGQPLLGLPALGGLFDAGQCPHLSDAKIENRWLLAAIFHLGYFRQATGLTRVNYRDMGPEELGSVYESLLELVPDIQSLGQPHAAKLAFVGDDDTDASTKGNTRKLTGSYYTPDSLVQELIKSALNPVIAATVKANPERPVDALLQLTVCDPACGSGHFLLAAARRLADEVAKLRAAQTAAETSAIPVTESLGEQQAYRHALRDVVSHCIYGVDKNPMAIALAKTALWLEAYTPDRPLTFLDHHLQVGDALLGVLDPKVLENGIPDEAYAVLSGDDKATAAALKKQNKADLKSWKEVAVSDLFQANGLAAQADAVEHLADDDLQGIAAKRSAWARTSAEAQHSTLASLADTYVAAFLAPKVPESSALIPLSGYLWGLFHPTLGQPAKADIAQAAYNLCRTHSVFHWWLAFPQVAAKGGFSVMLGNPPWERIKLQEEEFFATRSPLVAMAKNKSERGKRIELLRQGLLLHTLSPDVEVAEGLSPPNRAEMHLHQEFIGARRGAEAASLYAHDSGRYPLTGIGDVNTYALFAETIFQLTAQTGRSGFIVPTGIATDDTTKVFFGKVVITGRLAQLVSFYEVRRWFPATDERKPFCLFTVGTSSQAKFIFDVDKMEDLNKVQKWYELSPQDFKRLNPNTLTLPTFRSQRDAELTKKLYCTVPVLIAEGQGEGGTNANQWGISFQRMLDMSTDSGLFLDTTSVYPPRLPLYEGKLIHQFDHRWGSYVDAPDKPKGLDTEDVRTEQKANPAFTLRPQYWVDQCQVLARIARVPSRVANAWLTWYKAWQLAENESPSEAYAGHDGELLSVSQAVDDSADKLTLALAGWVAGELFRQAAGVSGPAALASASLWEARALPRPPAPQGWTNQQRQHGLRNTENVLVESYPAFNRMLKAAYPTSTQLLGALTKWAQQDDPAQGLSLSDVELAELQALQQQAIAIERGTAGAVEISANSQLEFKFLNTWMDRRSPRWLMGWRDITNAAAERTVIASVVPRVGVAHTMPLLWTRQPAAQQAALLANWNSMVFDYIARQKVGGTHLTYGYLKQFPVLPPECYLVADLVFIVPRILELTFTAHALQAWADDLAAYDPRRAIERATPFAWNPERRAQLRAELDAYYARLYKLTRDELRYILDPADVMGADYPSETFRVLKKNEINEFGEYRTRRLVLEAWDSLAAGIISLQQVEVTSPVYSEQGVIRTKQQAEFAGLIAALISLSTEGISVSGLQDVVAHVPMAATYLESADSARLGVLAGTVDALSLKTVLTLIPPIVQRVEASGAIVRRRSGNTSLYFAGTSALPADVLTRPEHAEIAQLMLRLDASRALFQKSQFGEAEKIQQTQSSR